MCWLILSTLRLLGQLDHLMNRRRRRHRRTRRWRLQLVYQISQLGFQDQYAGFQFGISPSPLPTSSTLWTIHAMAIPKRRYWRKGCSTELNGYPYFILTSRKR